MRDLFGESIEAGERPKPRPDVGIMCTRCHCRDFFVVYTRPQQDGSIRRRRECRHCGKQVTTRERPLGEDADGSDAVRD